MYMYMDIQMDMCMQLKDAGLTMKELRVAARFSSNELYAIGCTLVELREGGYPLKQLKEQVGFTAEDFRAAGFLAEELEDVGFTAKQLKECGYDSEAMGKCSYTAEEFRAAGYTAAELKTHLSLTAQELADGGFKLAEIRTAGFPAWQLKGVAAR